MFKKTKIIILFITMIFFSNKIDANYDKIFFEHEIKNIDGELISLEMYRDKVVLLVNTASYCGFTNNIQIYKNYMKIIKKKIL